MKKQVFVLIALFISAFAFGQERTPAGSFDCSIGSAKDFTIEQINTYVGRGNFESYRLRNERNTLAFDNGFYVTLLSASELVQKGLIKDASTYQESFPAGFKKPVFHMTPNGNIGAGYALYERKPSSKKQ